MYHFVRALSVALLLSGCARTIQPQPAHVSAPTPRARIALTYQGVASWQLDAGPATVLIDPYFSRPEISPEALLTSDAALVARHMPPRADAILIGHSHADHLLDAPSA